MASKRITKSAINWAKLAERVPADQKTNFQTFKSKSDIYIRAVLANPENPPKIDWEYYKKLIPNAALVNDFQKKYESLQVPYPADKFTPEIEKEIIETKNEIEQFKKESNSQISAYTQKVAHLQSLLPYDQMTMEDYQDSFPEVALNPLKRPTLWPHTAEEQIGHQDKDAPPPAH